MLKYVGTQIVFQEVPDEVSLAINLSLCPNHCDGCHSPELWEDIGEVLDLRTLDELIEKNKGITCVAFMGGDNDVWALYESAKMVHSKFGLKTCWYSGRDSLSDRVPWHHAWDYIKLGHYDKELGGLDKKTTNQRLWSYCPIWSGVGPMGKCWKDITSKFWE